MKIKLEEDYPEYDDGPLGGDILEVVSFDENEGCYYCKFNGKNDHVVYEYEVEEVIKDTTSK